MCENNNCNCIVEHRVHVGVHLKQKDRGEVWGSFPYDWAGPKFEVVEGDFCPPVKGGLRAAEFQMQTRFGRKAEG